MRHRFHAPGSTAETPDKQCKGSQQSERTKVRVTLIGWGRLAWFALIGLTYRTLAWVTLAIFGPAVTRLADAPGHGTVTREDYLGDRSGISEGVVLRTRNQKREKQNADGR